MRALFAALVFAVSSVQAIDLPIPPIVVAHTASVLRVNIRPGASIREAIVPVKDSTGAYGRKIRADVLQFQWCDSAGTPIPDSALTDRISGDIVVTGAELEAAGVAAGTPWASAKGDAEENVTFVAAVSSIAARAIDNPQARPAWVAATVSALKLKLASGEIQ